MGVPAFYRWLVERFPRSVIGVKEESPSCVNGGTVPVDTTGPNPNGVEFDNLYLDMNGIIHPCFHPEGLIGPETYDQVFKAVFMYIDRIFSIIRPRKLLYMAIDGVAPRAKMNQQRARRFRAAKDAADEVAAKGNGREGLAMKKLDSNVITPGTQFMELLSSALKYYVHLRMNNDPGWQGIKVILSDANVPGEGEHKIMTYIRLQRNLPGYDANTRHCFYGLDADLIMLALATHEIHFYILREDVRKVGYSGNGRGSPGMNRQRNSRNTGEGRSFSKDFEEFISKQKFQFLKVWVLREYLSHELRIQDPSVNADMERLIDDFVFMCLFVGNDFLPHIPSLEISEGAIDLLVNVYKKEFVQMGGYLTDCSKVNLERVEHFIQAVGSYENAIFRKRNMVQKEWERCLPRFAAKPIVKEGGKGSNHIHGNSTILEDKVKLGEEGWKERYYVEKFEVQTEQDSEGVRNHVVLKYIEGLCWIMHYYYQGVSSWQWFYPYHYAPFASDFRGLQQLEIHFTLGAPFKPFDQLMSVLPAASAEALPLYYRKLMTDPSSPVLDFYPTDFELDMNGKRRAWQAVCKLPFIEESRLLSAIAKIEDTLTVEEKQRNRWGMDVLFLYISHPLSAEILSLHEQKNDKAYIKSEIDPTLSGGMNGYMCISDNPVCPAEIYSTIEDLEMIKENRVISVLYEWPSYHPHIPRPPKGVTMPRKAVNKQDIIAPPILWHVRTAVIGGRVAERPLPRNCVLGPYLAKLAHQLVLRHQNSNQSSGKNEEHGKRKDDGLDDELKQKWRKSSKSEQKEDNGGSEKSDQVGNSAPQLSLECFEMKQQGNGDYCEKHDEVSMSKEDDVGDKPSTQKKKRKRKRSKKTEVDALSTNLDEFTKLDDQLEPQSGLKYQQSNGDVSGTHAELSEPFPQKVAHERESQHQSSEKHEEHEKIKDDGLDDELKQKWRKCKSEQKDDSGGSGKSDQVGNSAPQLSLECFDMKQQANGDYCEKHDEVCMSKEDDVGVKPSTQGKRRKRKRSKKTEVDALSTKLDEFTKLDDQLEPQSGLKYQESIGDVSGIHAELSEPFPAKVSHERQSQHQSSGEHVEHGERKKDGLNDEVDALSTKLDGFTKLDDQLEPQSGLKHQESIGDVSGTHAELSEPFSPKVSRECESQHQISGEHVEHGERKDDGLNDELKKQRKRIKRRKSSKSGGSEKPRQVGSSAPQLVLECFDMKLQANGDDCVKHDEVSMSNEADLGDKPSTQNMKRKRKRSKKTKVDASNTKLDGFTELNDHLEPQSGMKHQDSTVDGSGSHAELSQHFLATVTHERESQHQSSGEHEEHGEKR